MHLDVPALPPSLDPDILSNTTVIAISRDIQEEKENFRIISYLDFVVEQVTAGFASYVRANDRSHWAFFLS